MFGKEYWPIFTFTVTQQVIFVFARTANLCSLLPSYRVKKRRIYGEPAVPFFFLAVAHILLQLPPLTDTFHQNNPPGETSWSTSSSSITAGILALFLHSKSGFCIFVHLTLLLGLEHVLPGRSGAAAAKTRATSLLLHPVQHAESQHQEETCERQTRNQDSKWIVFTQSPQYLIVLKKLWRECDRDRKFAVNMLAGNEHDLQ